jgi:hypothetical protein
MIKISNNQFKEEEIDWQSAIKANSRSDYSEFSSDFQKSTHAFISHENTDFYKNEGIRITEKFIFFDKNNKKTAISTKWISAIHHIIPKRWAKIIYYSSVIVLVCGIILVFLHIGDWGNKSSASVSGLLAMSINIVFIKFKKLAETKIMIRYLTYLPILSRRYEIEEISTLNKNNNYELLRKLIVDVVNKAKQSENSTDVENNTLDESSSISKVSLVCPSFGDKIVWIFISFSFLLVTLVLALFTNPPPKNLYTIYIFEVLLVVCALFCFRRAVLSKLTIVDIYGKNREIKSFSKKNIISVWNRLTS